MLNSMANNQKGVVQVLLILLILIGLGAGAILVRKPTTLRSKASLDSTRIEIAGPSISGDRTTSRNVKVRLVYIPPASSPTPSPTVNPTSTPTPISIPSTNPTAKSSPGVEEKFCSSDQDCPEGYFCPEIMSFAPGPVGVDRICQLGKPASPTPTSTTKTGTNSFSVAGACEGGYKFANFECHDGFSGQVGDENTCRTSNQLGELAKEQCQNRSSVQRVKGITTYAQGLFPTHFKIANTQAGLEIAQERVFTQNNQEVDWELPEGNGLKTIYAQFKVNRAWESLVNTTIILDISADTSNPSSTPISSPTNSPTPVSTPNPQSSNINPVCQSLYNKIQERYRSSCEDSGYDVVADVNKDRIINSLDLGQVRQNANNQEWCQQRLNDQTNPCINTQTINPTPLPTPAGNIFQQIWQSITNLTR